jgi:diacylglycerol kinase (ATP)
VERVLLAGTCLLVLVTELLNSAIEATIDRIGNDHHELSGRAKDMGSAAVFMSLCTVALTWGLIGYERLTG